LRAKRAGFQIWTAPQAKIWHKVSASFVGGKPHTHYFWWRSRLLWIERNCPFAERKRLYTNLIFPELWKHFRHYMFKSLQAFFTRSPAAHQKALRYKAGLTGALHYAFGKFGNCPRWILK
jgi:GT2 family glycosyltransferase